MRSLAFVAAAALALPAAAQDRPDRQLLFDLGEVQVDFLNLFGPSGPTDFVQTTVRGAVERDLGQLGLAGVPVEVTGEFFFDPGLIGGGGALPDVPFSYGFEIDGREVGGDESGPGFFGGFDLAGGTLSTRTVLTPTFGPSGDQVERFVLADDRGTATTDDDLLTVGYDDPYRPLGGTSLFDSAAAGGFGDIVAPGFELVDLILEVELDGDLPARRYVELFGPDPDDPDGFVFDRLVGDAFEAATGLDLAALESGGLDTPLTVGGVAYEFIEIGLFTEGRITGQGRVYVSNALPLPAPIPLPAGLPLLALGLGALAGLRRRGT